MAGLDGVDHDQTGKRFRKRLRQKPGQMWPGAVAPACAAVMQESGDVVSQTFKGHIHRVFAISASEK